MSNSQAESTEALEAAGSQGRLLETEFAPDGDPTGELDNKSPLIDDQNNSGEQRSRNEVARLR